MAAKVHFGLTLPNRGVLIGVETMVELVQMGVDAEKSGLFKSLWVGDSILANRLADCATVINLPPKATLMPSSRPLLSTSGPPESPPCAPAEWINASLK